MNVSSTTAVNWGVPVDNSRLMRAAPQPRSLSGSWSEAAGTVLSATQRLAGLASGFGDVTGVQNLLQQQIQIQQVMQTVSMISNVERSRHETEMAPIRNMRVG